ncbi:MAG: glycosyltransferase family 2 protein [Deltaproteobacteria bacterium]|nr:glycosyltransferase family 2 protein [Deltaproteobacteria bacterium]MBW2362079.1 glycosyltransferase family 2 protein [Deltaproteobacteria bacterium]
MGAPLRSVKTDMLARPCATPGAVWHGEALALATGERAAYHQAWLHHLEHPGEPEAAPLVSVVIPVRDGNAWIRDAVESALRQTHPRLEVVVVDDGSTDPPDRVLGDLDRVRILRQPARGVAAARNHGLREAAGVLVQFLDADDLMDEDAVALKVAAFREVADAEICVSSYRTIGSHAEKDASTHRPPPLGDALCPTRDLLETVMERYPFHTSTLLAARWVLLDVGPMDEALPHGEDARYWFLLGVRGTKVVAVNAELGTRRFVSTGLTSEGAAQRLSWARVGALNVIDTLREPRLWIFLGVALRRLIRRLWEDMDGNEDALLEELRGGMLAAVAGLPALGRQHGLSVRPPLALLEALIDELGPSGEAPGLLLPRLAAATRAAWAEGTEPGANDVELWLRHRCRRSTCLNQAAFDELLASTEARLYSGDAQLPDPLFEGLVRRGGPLREQRLRSVRQLVPRLGPRLALGVARVEEEAARTWGRIRRVIRVRTRLRALRGRFSDAPGA